MHVGSKRSLNKRLWVSLSSFNDTNNIFKRFFRKKMGTPIIVGKQKIFFSLKYFVPPCQADLGPSKITIGWLPGMPTGYLTKRTNRKYVSFGMKMLLYQKLPYITWNVPGLLTSHILLDNYHCLDKGADTVQPACTYFEEASSYFIRSLNTQ